MFSSVMSVFAFFSLIMSNLMRRKLQSVSLWEQERQHLRLLRLLLLLLFQPIVHSFFVPKLLRPRSRMWSGGTQAF